MKLTELRALLTTRKIQLTKSLGQNFLHDGNQLRHIIDAAELEKTDKVLEIGPGLGPLTELILEKAGEVLAIEKDLRLVEVLRERFFNPQFELLHDDVLEFLPREARDWSDWKLVANLPYSVASTILVELAQAPKRLERMVATLQLEVAHRLRAGPGDDDYGVLTLLLQLDYELRDWFKIPAGCFFPAPDVDSACVVLIRRKHPPLSDPQRGMFTKIVKRAFSQRRKMMFKLLREDWPAEHLERAFEQLKLPSQIRAEAIGLEAFVQLTRQLSP